MTTEAGRRHIFLAGGNPERKRIVSEAVAAIEAEAAAPYSAVVDAARALRAFGPSNRSGDKYAAKLAAFDALDDALDALL